MAEDKEPFLARWSRLKRQKPPAPETRDAVPAKAPQKPLPPVESLTPESDFTPFMQPNVSEELRRMALKKLLRDPQLNVPDPFEPFSGDWTVGEPIPPDMLGKLNQARTLLMKPEERKALEEKEQAEREKTQTSETPKEPEADEPGRQDS